MSRIVPKLARLYITLGLCLCTVAQAESGPEELTRAAQFVFRGTIQKIETSNLNLVQADSDTAVVRVDEVLKAAPSLGDFTGRAWSVRLHRPEEALGPAAARPGEQSPETARTVNGPADPLLKFASRAEIV